MGLWAYGLIRLFKEARHRLIPRLVVLIVTKNAFKQNLLCFFLFENLFLLFVFFKFQALFQGL